jgi:uncharacterized membrane protein (TIGR01666 family)
VHERINSTHGRYRELAEIFSRTDVMFRFKYLLETQAQTCRAIARAIRAGEDYHHSDLSGRGLNELHNSIAYLNEQNHTDWKTGLNQLNYLFHNLSTIEKLLSNVSHPDESQFEEGQLSDTDPRGLKSMWQQIKINLQPDSLLFRHAVRMSLALTAGYTILQSFDLALGYWILLTTLFVCQPNFSATKQKITLRVIGTVTGLLIGALLLDIISSRETQTLLIVVSGVLFFAFRTNNYAYATAFITILVLLCFNQFGAGYAVILPRLIDTIIGCGLAVFAVTYILPDWHARRLHKVMAAAIRTNKSYLDQIIAQYRTGKKDNLSYRIARRDAHDQDAALTTAIHNMLSEPGKYHKAVDESFRFLTLNHALLSYISALGAHRTRLDDQSTHQLILKTHRVIHHHLEALHQQLEQGQENCNIDYPRGSGLENQLLQWREDSQGKSIKLILQQLHLIHRILPELQSLTQKFVVRVL